MVSVSVIIATLKSRDEIETIRCLESHGFDDYEVIVCDESPVTRARNEGIRRASTDKLIFLDDDSRPRPGYLRRANEVLEREAAYAGRTIHPFDDVFARHFTNHYDWGEDPCYVNRFWGCNMGVHRRVFETVGGWDEQMGWGHEEKELARRVRSGFNIRYDPELVVEHPYASSITEYWKKQYKLETKSPYYWSKCDISRAVQLENIVCEALDPLNYIRRTPVATVTEAGSTVAKTVGRIRGLLEGTQRGEDVGEIPDIGRRTESPPELFD
ncbi:glycosyltransferase [Haloarcula sp. 1CSR25-25]|uniref:glycosyltransferase family 2 protein n=1 Tax=Haloarcula sp. 1CSR25-25 TaxID=2862545 RepID=UPI00289429D2|nr:glycosyltransferase [Haloarcula sp. 1CSR25-25]MDT3435773.1 glycosyltransferase [Haloarcula sp. 1CSR25-25]